MVRGQSVDAAATPEHSGNAMAHPLGDQPGVSRYSFRDVDVCLGETSVS